MEIGFTFKFENLPTPGDIAARLKMQAKILEGVPAKQAAKDDEEETPKAALKKQATKKAKATTDDDETFGDMMDETPEIEEEEIEAEAEAEEEIDEAAEFKKLAKAFRHLADTKGVDKAAAILKKLKVKSVKDLEWKQYAQAYKLLGIKA